MKAELPRTPFLYPIIDTRLCRSRQIDPVVLCDAYLAGGARVLQLRDKERSSGEFLSLTDALVQRADRVGALVIVNDRADIARMSGAAGVHVGQDDLSIADVRKLLPEPAIVGLSTHDHRQVDSAIEQNPTYVAVGPVYGTSTKETGYSARGLEFVRRAAARGRPVVAIGGLTLDNVADVVGAGAMGIAVISDLVTADPEARTRAFIERLAEATARQTRQNPGRPGRTP